MKKEHEKFSDSNLLEGMVSVRAVISQMKDGFGDRRIIELLYAVERKENNKKEFAWLTHRAEEFGFSITLKPLSEISEECIGNTHGGVLARCTARSLPLLCLDTPLPEKPFLVMLEGVEDPYNFGYAVRSLYAAGVDALILPRRNWMTAAGIVARASAGASELMQMYIADDSAEAVRLLQGRGIRTVSADISDSVSVYDADLTLPLLLIVGGERRGISRSILDLSDAIVRLDYGRTFDGALSAASAASILAFEVYRQNRHS